MRGRSYERVLSPRRVVVARDLPCYDAGVRMFIAINWEDMRRLKHMIDFLNRGMFPNPGTNYSIILTSDELAVRSRWYDEREKELTKKRFNFLMVDRALSRGVTSGRLLINKLYPF